ncbi:NrfD/PsrC family molybdoenzyme membrane anchor subunit [Sedimenticola sp.]|uniref:NrfD/PsrC family molybdoenzyme membrane anchor subunit n=1 Tax=Sedimenticola sp. TaxID=1940285 RepID=UPI003D12603E
MFEYMEYNIAPWGREIVIYFFLIGVAAMTFVYAAAPSVFGNVFGGVAKSMEPFQKIGLLVSLILLAICGPLLIMDLGQPSRFLYPILYFHWTSPLSWGSLFLPLFGLCIIGFYFGLMKGNQGMMRLTGILGSLLALSMPLYTGLDLMVHQTRELWSNPTIPLLFVILSMSSGTAVVAVIQLQRGQLNELSVEFLHAFLYLALAVTFALFLAEWVVLNYGTGEKQQAWEIINQQFGFKYWGMTFLIGILVPLVLVALPKLGRDPRVLTLAAVLSAVGAYSFREVLIYAGQLTQINF